MTSPRVTTLVLGSALLTTWLVSAGVVPGRDEPAPTPQTSRSAVPAPSALEIQTARLQARMEVATPPRRSSRNPFRFGVRAPIAAPSSPASRSDAVPAPSEPAARPVLPPTPTLKLVGIAIGDERDGQVRTAVLSVGGELVLVHAGDAVAGRYRVAAVSPDVVELVDRLGGPPLRLVLR